MSVRTGYLSLGSNLGDRERRIFDAVRRLDSDPVSVVACSSLYETRPAEGAGGDPFVNAVVEVRSLHCPEDLLNRLKTIEKSMGRSGGHNRPREIDIDIVSLGDLIVETPGLTIPHPRFRRRIFVLRPLAEIAPGFCCPVTGRTVGDMIGDIGDNETITRISGRNVIAVNSK